MRKRIGVSAAIVSGVFLALAFPPASQADIAFFALVPLLLAVRDATPRQGFRLGFAAGLAFWLLDIAWFWHIKDNGGPLPLVFLGHFSLSAYCALYTGLFGLGTATAWGVAKRRGSPLLAGLAALVAEPLLWVGAEYLRGSILSGFPWNPLAASQYRNPALLHAVSWGGAATLSALIVAINAGIASLLYRIWRDVFRPRFVAGATPSPGPRFRIRSAEHAIALLATLAYWSHGVSTLRADARGAQAAPRFRAALVHPDIPCIFEKDDDSVREANETLLRFTSFAAAATPSICLWPETSLPGYVPYDKESFELVTNAVHALHGKPLLAGAVELLHGGAPDESVPNPHSIFNSAFLFGPGGIRATYRKQHLVPFGEFIPLESLIPALKKLAPVGFSCTPGEDSGVFRANVADPASPSIGALICFEDAFPYLARNAANAGADLLVTLANDAWFDGSCESEQHLAQAVLRCVETRRPMLRCTNRGVSAFIDRNGRILRRIGDGRGAGEPGFAVHDLPVPTRAPLTPYARLGDWLLNIPAALFTLCVLGAKMVSSFSRKRHCPDVIHGEEKQ